jgi:hypothetical protein
LTKRKSLISALRFPGRPPLLKSIRMLYRRELFEDYSHSLPLQHLQYSSYPNLTALIEYGKEKVGFGTQLCLKPWSHLGRVTTHPGHQVAMTTKFVTVAPNVCGSSVWQLLHVTTLDFWSGCYIFWKFVHPWLSAWCKYSSTHSYQWYIESSRQVHSIPRPPYTRRRSTRFPISRRLERPRNRFGHFEQVKSLLRCHKFKINIWILFWVLKTCIYMVEDGYYDEYM